jgi:DNA repair exonuclease SbcCD nuclease subunit
LKIIRVGDPHAKPSNLDDLQKLLDFSISKALELKVSHIELLGDLFDTHLVMRMDVINFWQSFVHKADSLKLQVVAIVGNHDMVGDKQRETQMSALDSLKYISKYFKVIDKPDIFNGTAYMPYRSDEKEFTEQALYLLPQSNGTLVCHQTFDGSKFDNGMYAPHGFNVDVLSGFKQVISGHIHSTQRFSNILYIGTARWESLSDANLNKGIWLFEEGEDPVMIPTDKICQPIKLYEISEGSNIPEIAVGDKNHIVLKGSSQWISKTSKSLKGLGKITPRPTDTKNQLENRIEKISSLDAYSVDFKFENNIKYTEVLEYINNL